MIFTLNTFSRFPFFAADVLASNAMILQALLEGGWNNEKGEDEDSKKDKNTDLDSGNDEIVLIEGGACRAATPLASLST